MYKNKQDLYEYLKNRWHQRKINWIKKKGGKCECCGIEYNGKNAAIFLFHHINPEEKEFSWNKLRLVSEEKIKKEMNKTQLLCANCHELIHASEY